MTAIDPLSTMVDLQLERDVLGAILNFGVVDDYMTAGLAEDLFYRQEHVLVLKAAQAVAATGAIVDHLTVGQYLRAADELERIGGTYFSKMGDGVARPDGPTVTFQIVRLVELASTRDVHYANLVLQERLKLPGALADGAVGTHLDTLQAILERQHSPESLWHDAPSQLTAHQRETVDSTTAQRLAFGLPRIDDTMGGLRMGEVFGLLGRPGIGKTVFLTVITRAVADICGHVFFSLEMPASQIVGRLKQNLYAMTRHEVESRTRAGMIDEGLYLRTFDRLVIVDTPSLSLAEMSRRVRQIQKGPLRNIPIRMITIDHLGLVGGDRRMTTYDRISHQARELKEMAKRLECGVAVAIQVNREAGGDGSRELGLGSARDSGVVEEAMDYMVGIRRPDRSQTLNEQEREHYKNVILAKLIKNRHGDPDIGEVAYHFLPTMDLREDRSFKLESEDVARLAQQRAGGRR